MLDKPVISVPSVIEVEFTFKVTLLVYCSEPFTDAVAHLEAPLLNKVVVEIEDGSLEVVVVPPAVAHDEPPSVLFSHK